MQIIPFYLGVVSMQLVYLTYHYILFRRKDFLYYVLFTFSFTIFFASFTIPSFRTFGEKLTNGHLILTTMPFIMFGGAMYYRFIRYFTESVIYAPRYDKTVRITEYVLIACAIVMISNTLFFNRKFDFIYPILRYIYFANFIIQAYTIIYLIQSGKLLNIIVCIGSIAVALFVKVGILPIIVDFNPSLVQVNTFNYVFTGMIIDFLFFNFALIYKSRTIENDKVQLEIQKQTALFLQRTEIGNDLHDDVGASLSSLHVYSTIAEKELERNPVLAKKYLTKIASGIRLVMENMNDVIWAVNVNKLEGKLFSSRIKDFNMDLFDAKNIECVYKIDPDLEKNMTRMIVRKNLLLITKEAVNNVIKHSGASKVVIQLKKDGDHLSLAIEDNGVGVNPTGKTTGGNGLPSLELRTKQLGGQLAISKMSPKGTRVLCSIPLANISD